MKKVYVAPNPVDASLMHDLLQRKGIRATVHGLSLFSGRGQLPMTEETLPSIWVSDEDFTRAHAIIDEAQRKNKAAMNAKWTCIKCNEENPISFEVCWKCRNDRATSDSFSITGRKSEEASTKFTFSSRLSEPKFLIGILSVAVPLAGVAVFFTLRLLLPEGPPKKLSLQANEFLWGKANQPAVELMRQGQFEEAIGQIAEIRDQGRDNLFTLLLKGVLHAQVYEFNEAIESLTLAIKKEPNYYRGYLLRSNVYSEVSRNADANSDLHKAADMIRGDQEIPVVLIDHAEIALKLGDLEKAQSLIDQAYRDEGPISSYQRGQLHELQADLAMRKGAPLKAIQHLERSLEFPGLNDARHTKLGWALLKAGKEDEALLEFNEVLTRNVRNAEALAGRAAISQRRNDCINAINDLTNALILNGQNPAYYFDRAKCYFIGDELERADTDFRRAMDLNPTYKEKRAAFVRNMRRERTPTPEGPEP